jgi:hypothetical protein
MLRMEVNRVGVTRTREMCRDPHRNRTEPYTVTVIRVPVTVPYGPLAGLIRLRFATVRIPYEPVFIRSVYGVLRP